MDAWPGTNCNSRSETLTGPHSVGRPPLVPSSAAKEPGSYRHLGEASPLETTLNMAGRDRRGTTVSWTTNPKCVYFNCHARVRHQESCRLWANKWHHSRPSALNILPILAVTQVPLPWISVLDVVMREGCLQEGEQGKWWWHNGSIDIFLTLIFGKLFLKNTTKIFMRAEME